MGVVDLDEVDTGLVEAVAQRGAIIIPGTQEPRAIRYVAGRGASAAMAASLGRDSDQIGVMTIERSGKGPGFSTADFALAQELAVATALLFRRGPLRQSVAELSHTHTELMHRSLHDPLTGLPNQALFMERLGQALLRQDRSHRPTALIVVDLDHVRDVNERVGHAAGDALLIEVASRLRGHLRRSDTAARLGGNEFSLLLVDLRDESEAVHVTERIVESLRSAFSFQATDVSAQGSVGLAISGAEEVASAAELLSQATRARCAARDAGGDRYTVFSPDLATAVEDEAIADDLRKGIGAQEIELDYQPIFDIDTGIVLGAEALVRWNHPKRGRLGPAEFIAAAENEGLAATLGNEVLRMALRQLSRWQQDFPREERPLGMSVNISARHLAQPYFTDDVLTIVADAQVDPDCVILEFTESALLGDLNDAVAKLDALQRGGIHLAIDDVGTGHATLGYLKRLPVDILKIGRPFVEALIDDVASDSLARQIVEEGTALRMSIVAEGVESPAQIRRLRELGCSMAQGYHLARPMDPAAMRDLVATGGVDPQTFAEVDAEAS